MTTHKTYPIEPLAEAIGLQLCQPGRRHGTVLEHDERPDGAPALAEALNVSERTIRRWHNAGISAPRADHYACDLGLHPRELWPDWDDDLESEENEPGYYTDDPPLDTLTATT